MVPCLGGSDADRLMRLAAVLSVGARARWCDGASALWSTLPEPVRDRVELVDSAGVLELADGIDPPETLAAALDAIVRDDAAVLIHQGEADARRRLLAALAARAGPIIQLVAIAPGETVPLERLVVERSVSINTAAAGGNASLMLLD